MAGSAGKALYASLPKGWDEITRNVERVSSCVVGGLSELPTFTDFSKTTINSKNTLLCCLRVFQSQKNIYKPLFGLSQVKLLIYPKSCKAPTSYTYYSRYKRRRECRAWPVLVPAPWSRFLLVFRNSYTAQLFTRIKKPQLAPGPFQLHHNYMLT